MKRLILIIGIAVLFSSCSMLNFATRGEQYAQMYEEKPHTLLVMPPINNTTNIEAKELLYTSISKPLIEAGYYVISPHLAMEILKAESAYDSELFVEAPLGIFKTHFGCDAVVFSEILTWAKQGLGISTDIRYFIKSTTTGEILFDRTCHLFLDLTVDSESNNAYAALFDLALSVVATAATDHIVAARKANYFIFRDIPRGPYSPDYLNDMDVIAEERNVSATVK